jgi:putative addiction module component (TIGR02574 family)
MSLEQLESAILGLSPEERWRLAEWFEQHLAELLGDAEGELSEEQKAEILRRREAFLADPSIAEPWEGTAERIRQHLHARRAQKVAPSGR